MDFRFTPKEEALRKQFDDFYREEMKNAPPEWGTSFEAIYGSITPSTRLDAACVPLCKPSLTVYQLPELIVHGVSTSLKIQNEAI